jgi:chromosome segregation ATPase
VAKSPFKKKSKSSKKLTFLNYQFLWLGKHKIIFNEKRPLEELDDRFKDVKDNLKVAKKAASEKYEHYNRIREECRDIQEKIQKSDDEWKKQKNETTPAIQRMKDEYRAKIDALKEKKKEHIKKHREAWTKYNDQQAEIDRIRKMQKIKERLLRDEERRKRNEEYAKLKKAQEEENREVPFLNELGKVPKSFFHS